MNLVRRFCNFPVAVGNPADEKSWLYFRAGDLELPLFNIGSLLLIDGGYRLLLFRWLALVDDTAGRLIWQPLLWFELTAHYCQFRVTIPWRIGAVTLRIPLSLAALKDLGVINLKWEDWRDKE